MSWARRIAVMWSERVGFDEHVLALRRRERREKLAWLQAARGLERSRADIDKLALRLTTRAKAPWTSARDAALIALVGAEKVDQQAVDQELGRDGGLFDCGRLGRVAVFVAINGMRLQRLTPALWRQLQEWGFENTEEDARIVLARAWLPQHEVDRYIRLRHPPRVVEGTSPVSVEDRDHISTGLLKRRAQGHRKNDGYTEWMFVKDELRIKITRDDFDAVRLGIGLKKPVGRPNTRNQFP